MVNFIFYFDYFFKLVNKELELSISDLLENVGKFIGFWFYDGGLFVVEVGLMVVLMVYKLSLYK